MQELLKTKKMLEQKIRDIKPKNIYDTMLIIELEKSISIIEDKIRQIKKEELIKKLEREFGAINVTKFSKRGVLFTGEHQELFDWLKKTKAASSDETIDLANSIANKVIIRPHGVILYDTNEIELAWFIKAGHLVINILNPHNTLDYYSEKFKASSDGIIENMDELDKVVKDFLGENI